MMLKSKNKFCYSKYAVNINNVGVNKIIFKKASLSKEGFKYFIGCKYFISVIKMTKKLNHYV